MNQLMLKPLSRQSGVFTAFPQRSNNCTSPRCALCNRIERHVVAFILNMLKINLAGLAFTQRVRQRDVGTLWQRCGVLLSAVGALWAPRVHAVQTPCKSCIWTRRLRFLLIII